MAASAEIACTRMNGVKHVLATHSTRAEDELDIVKVAASRPTMARYSFDANLR